jgi:hypothetical protein
MSAPLFPALTDAEFEDAFEESAIDCACVPEEGPYGVPARCRWFIVDCADEGYQSDYHHFQNTLVIRSWARGRRAV